MHKYYLIVTMAIYTLICTSCNTGPVDGDLIVGNWQAINVQEEGEALEINPQEIKLSFTAEEKYFYQSTLNYKEAGSYYIDTRYLFTVDTLNQASTEKAVEIITLTADSLCLKMNDKGRERLLNMVKI